jgi:hypothetical protein
MICLKKVTKLADMTVWKRIVEELVTSVADPDLPHLAGSGFLDADLADPDPRLQNWHLINLFSVEKYIIVNKFKCLPGGKKLGIHSDQNSQI